MNFSEAITSGFQNYFNFSTRAQRSAYWYWVLFAVLASIVATLIDMAVFSRSEYSPINILANLALFLPGLAVAVRRLHDIDRSGWWILLFLIPIVGAIILIIWFCSGGTDGANRFGPNPLAGRT
jgi:uncharacterized membrane protein YhaH (DUF805 family)